MPFVLTILGWAPLLVSAVLLVSGWIAWWSVGVGSARALTILSIWGLGAAYLQLFGGSVLLATSGLVLQVILAITMIVRARLQP